MTDEDRLPGEDPEDGRFRPKPRAAAGDESLYDPAKAKSPRPITLQERAADARADVEEIVVQCQKIVDRGEGEFFDKQDARNRLAAKTLLIDLATACEQLDDFQAHAPDLWKAIKRTRDKMAHHYRDTNFTRVWETISAHVPTVLEQIREAHSES